MLESTSFLLTMRSFLEGVLAAHIVLIFGFEVVSIAQMVFFIWCKVLWEISLGFEALVLSQVDWGFL